MTTGFPAGSYEVSLLCERAATQSSGRLTAGMAGDTARHRVSVQPGEDQSTGSLQEVPPSHLLFACFSTSLCNCCVRQGHCLCIETMTGLLPGMLWVAAGFGVDFQSMSASHSNLLFDGPRWALRQDAKVYVMHLWTAPQLSDHAMLWQQAQALA